jgi:hypothetical protein
MDKGRITRWLQPKMLNWFFFSEKKGNHPCGGGDAGAPGGSGTARSSRGHAAPRILWARETEEPCEAWPHRPRPRGRRGGRAGRGRPTRPACRGGGSMASLWSGQVAREGSRSISSHIGWRSSRLGGGSENDHKAKLVTLGLGLFLFT